MPTFSRLHNESEEKVSIVLPDAMRRRRLRVSCQLWWAGVATVLCVVFMIALIIVAKHSHEIAQKEDIAAHSEQQQTPCPVNPQTTPTPNPVSKTTQPSSQLPTTEQSTATTTTEVPTESTTKAPADDICMTPACIEAAGSILSKMDVTANPCVDFYQYACGGFEKKTFLPPDDAKNDLFRLLGEKNLEIIQTALTADRTTLYNETSKALKKAQDLYKQCINIEELQKVGAEPLKEALTRMGWYHSFLLGNNTSESWILQDEIIKLQRLQLYPLYSVSLSPDRKNSSNYVFQAHQHGLSLNSEKDYNKTYDGPEAEKKKQAFIKYGERLFSLIGMTNETLATEKISAIYEFEKELAAIYIPAEDYRDTLKSYTKLNITQLQAKVDSHLNILQTVSDVYNVTDRGITFDDDTDIVTLIPQYFSKLKDLLDNYNTPEKNKILSDYLAWYLIHNTIEYLDPNFLYAQLILKNATAGVTALKPRWKVCTNKVSGFVSRAVDALYLENAFSEEDKKQVESIVEQVTELFKTQLSSYDWMENRTREEAIEKSINMVKNVGYPDYMKNVTSIDEYHSKFEVGKNYYESNLNRRRWFTDRLRLKVDTVPDRTIWGMDVVEVNAYYDPSFNVIALPAGILQAPFFDKDWPAAWNYGGMGAVVAHEVSHAYDDQGSEYDQYGNLNNWWTNVSKTAFNDKSKCFEDQYNQYKLYGLPVSGKRTLGENIADNGGISLAYKSYKNLNLPKHTLPGLKSTADQLFFLSFAQKWCIKSTEEYVKLGIAANPHSPPQFRVQGPFSNSAEFTVAYNCSANSDYNLENICKIW